MFYSFARKPHLMILTSVYGGRRSCPFREQTSEQPAFPVGLQLGRERDHKGDESRSG